MKKLVIGLVSAIVIAIGGAYVISPYYQSYVIAKSIKNNDAQVFNDHIDYPILRKNMQETIIKAGTKALGIPNGNMMNAEIFNKLTGVIVDRVIKPEILIHILKQKSSIESKKPISPSDSSLPSSSDTKKIEYKTDYVSLNSFSIILNKPNEPESKVAKIMLTRYNYINWKITNIDMFVMQQVNNK